MHRYRTRDGHEVEIYRIAETAYDEGLGAILFKDDDAERGWDNGSWNLNGRYMTNKEDHDFDVTEELGPIEVKHEV
jgi:hypothetical protein